MKTVGERVRHGLGVNQEDAVAEGSCGAVPSISQLLEISGAKEARDCEG
jgi:hypothetical protein